MRTPYLAVAIAIAACSSGHHGSTTATPRSACDVRGNAPPAARALAVSVDRLDAMKGKKVDHVQLLQALRALESSLQVVAPSHVKEIAAVHQSGTTLSRAIGNTDAHADFVRIGLVNASRALAAEQPAYSGVACYRDELAAMTEAAQRIDPNKKLVAQYAEVRAALRAASHVVLAASTEQIATASGRGR